MRKLVVVLIGLFSCLAMQAGEPEKREILSSKIILQNTEGYFILSDGSYWKTVPFVKRWRTLSEWWNGDALIPQNYECVPSDWYIGAEIDVYPKYENLIINEANASNQEMIKQCTHLFVNTKNGQILFAISLHPIECLNRLFKDAHQEGYDAGYSKGREAVYENAGDAYNQGCADGYKGGYREGYQAGFAGLPLDAEEGH